jgi:hypothetical protein
MHAYLIWMKLMADFLVLTLKVISAVSLFRGRPGRRKRSYRSQS